MKFEAEGLEFEYIRTIRIQIGKKYWDLETCRKSTKIYLAALGKEIKDAIGLMIISPGLPRNLTPGTDSSTVLGLKIVLCGHWLASHNTDLTADSNYGKSI